MAKEDSYELSDGGWMSDVRDRSGRGAYDGDIVTNECGGSARAFFSLWGGVEDEEPK